MEAYSVFFVDTMRQGQICVCTRICIYRMYRHMGGESDMAKNGDLSVDKGKNYKLYNELCDLSKYCYAMKRGLTKQNYTKYTKKLTRT